MRRLLRRFCKDEQGASLVEYSLLIALISVAVIVLIALVGDYIVSAWTKLNSTLYANPV